MGPLHAARIEDLGPGDLVPVECAACGHDVLIPPGGLLRLAPTTRVLRGCAVPDMRACSLSMSWPRRATYALAPGRAAVRVEKKGRAVCCSA